MADSFCKSGNSQKWSELETVAAAQAETPGDSLL
jgi:hypothetical protein